MASTCIDCSPDAEIVWNIRPISSAGKLSEVVDPSSLPLNDKLAEVIVPATTFMPSKVIPVPVNSKV